jgi:hypothetical protein
MKTLASLWADFEKAIPANAPAVQRKEMRLIFYSGALMIFELLTSQISAGEEIQESDMTMMEAIHQELETFVKELST